MGAQIQKQIQFLVLKIGLVFAVLVVCGFGVTGAHEELHGHAPHDHHHHGGCRHGHHHHHHHNHEGEGVYQHGRHGDVDGGVMKRKLLPEELAEEEDLKLYGFGGGDHQHHHHHNDRDYHGAAGDGELSGLGNFY